MTTLVLHDLLTGDHHVVEVRRVLVAGFTGRDTEAVRQHIEELAAVGVPVPTETPALYRLGPDRVTQGEVLVVSGGDTSGEVEPVVVRAGGRSWLTVGSDHTDREVERTSIEASKDACAKVVGTECMALDALESWDEAALTSRIDSGERYQEGSLAELLPLPELLGELDRREAVRLDDGDVLFCGTVPAIGGIRPSRRFEGKLHVPGVGSLEVGYRVVDVASTGARPSAKPELEFSPVDAVAWTPVDPRVPGQTERILARDPASGLATRMLRFEPGTDTSRLGVLRHDFWEEVYILSGELHDLTLDRVFPAGTYACRPPGMPHGPWRSEPGCVTFEVRYPAV
jgi:4-hydroxyphenylacetate 3-monooxygenase